MLAGLDPHSTFLDQDHFKEMQQGTAGEFGGLGIEVGMEDGFVKVISRLKILQHSKLVCKVVTL